MRFSNLMCKMKKLKFMLSLIFGAVLLLVFLFGVFLFYIHLKDYIPQQVEELQVIHKQQKIVTGSSFELISWNIGYAGLGSEMDFFYDGGVKTRTTEPETRRYMDGISAFVKSQPSADFWLFQEVDFKAKRTYGMDQSVELAHSLPDFNYVMANNYVVPFVPVPISDPMGQVKAGMMTFSRFSPRMSRRYAYPQIAGWPDRMFLLDRCFIELRVSLGDGRELVVLNTHNSAFVDQQNLMDMELGVIHDKMLREYELGNYVIAGGDWNMNPPGFASSGFFPGHHFEPSAVNIGGGFLPEGWNFAFGKNAPTNRSLAKAYEKGVSGVALIDFFITSPNISVLDIETIDLNFAHSDHNPIRLRVLLQ